MAISKFGYSLMEIRSRGKQTIPAGVVFEHNGDKEVQRLYGMDAFREATDDETKLYEARVKDGELAARVLGKDENEADDVVVTDGTGQTKKAEAPDNKKVNQAGATSKDGKKADEDL